MEELALEFTRDGMASISGNWWLFLCDNWRRLALLSTSWGNSHQIRWATSALCQREDTTYTLSPNTPKVVSIPLYLCSIVKLISTGLCSWGYDLSCYGWLQAWLGHHSITFWELLGLSIWYILFFTLPLLLN